MDAGFLIGQNVKTILTLNGKKLTVFLQNGSAKPNKTEWTDDVCGEQRSRLGYVLNFWDLMLNVWMLDTAPLKSFLDYEDNTDTGGPLQAAQLGILVSPGSGARQSFVARDVVIGVWELPWSNRANRSVFPIPMRAKYFSAVATF